MFKIIIWIISINLVLCDLLEENSELNLKENDNQTTKRMPGERRVFNGVDTAPGSYPFIVSLKRRDGYHFCAGTIINKLWVLTAAHCISGINIRNILICSGMFDLRSRSQRCVKIERVIVHKDYSPSRNWANDIALIKVSRGFDYLRGQVEAVILPKKNIELPINIYATLIGWGQDNTGYQRNHLQEADLIVISDRDCYIRHNGRTTTNQLCATLIQGGSRQCNGDSGGPLIYNGRIQIGIVSWSMRPCGRTFHPGVYTKVSHYIDFIAFHINSAL